MGFDLSKQQSNLHHATVVNVAIGVIHYQQHYLLGFRHSQQHQGNRYEFIGGKIEANETALSALIRETNEETGIVISPHTAVKLGRLHHDYGDKKVCLQVYKVALDAEQYQRYRSCQYGREGQPLVWIPIERLLAGDYVLPAANKTILSWLQLPAQITITYPLSSFIGLHGSQSTEIGQVSPAWLAYHQQHIRAKSWVYVRPKMTELTLHTFSKKSIDQAKPLSAFALTTELMRLRPDICGIVAYEDGYCKNNKRIVALHLTQRQLMHWFKKEQETFKDQQTIAPNCLTKDYPLIVSCHDIQSIRAANQLALLRIKHHLPAVIGMFLSPVLPTQSHPHTSSLGWKKWSRLAEQADMPVIGLGGLSPYLLEQATRHGATSIAGIRQFLSDDCIKGVNTIKK